MALQVVSTPAMSTSAATPSTTLSSTGTPSTSLWRSSLNKSSPGSALRRSTSADEELDEALDAPAAPLGVVGELEHVPDPAGEGVRQRGRHAEDGGDHPHRDLLGVVAGGIGGPLARSNPSTSPAHRSRVIGS